MAERLGDIDTSALDKLLAVKQEEDRIRGFLAKAEELKEKTSPSVFERVREDYARRLASLEERAAPVRVEVRRRYREFLELHWAATQALAGARAQKEELEFRHAIGELGDAESTARCREAEESLEQRTADMEKIERLRTLFLQVFPSIDDTEPEPEATPNQSEPMTSTSLDAGTRISKRAPTAPPPEEDPSAPDLEPTLLLPPARLVLEETGKEYPLGASNFIGRGSENHIRLAQPSVSRKHASISLSAAGFSIHDEDSASGTFVNGKRVTTHLLADGDRVRIGVLNLVFRSP